MATHISSDPYKAARKILKNNSTSVSDEHEELIKWKKHYREAGPVVFAHEVLKIDPITGKPLTLSQDQQNFLMDLAGDKIMFFILIAGRGSGKTFSLAIYITWRLCTNDYWSIAAMGGSAEQSTMIQKYTTLWKNKNNILKQIIIRDVKGREPEIRSMWDSSAFYLSCSEKSTRGHHCAEFLVDEEVAGEQDKEGVEAIQAAFFQVSTSEDVKIIRSSTCQNIGGPFYQTWQDAEKLGYKKYNWALARHINGQKDPYLTYRDTNPEHWFPNVPWTYEPIIRQYRKQYSNEKWLVEVLGGISVGSGLVYKPEDISISLSYCDACELAAEDCKPYTEECKLLQKVFKLSGLPDEQIPATTKECLTKINERILGQDYGHGSGADSTTIIGRYKGYVFILFNEESTGRDDLIKLDDIETNAKNWQVECLRPDPAEEAYNNTLARKNLVIHELEISTDKPIYIHVSKKFMERHKVVIPKCYTDLVRSLRNMRYKNGKVVKIDDHSFDSFCYAISRYGEIMDDEPNSVWEKQVSANPFFSNQPKPEQQILKNMFPETRPNNPNNDFVKFQT